MTKPRSKAGGPRAIRDEQGRFIKGLSGNPTGRRPVAPDVVELAQQYSPECILTAVRIMRSAKDPRVKLAAAELLLNRAHGRAAQMLTGPNGQPLVNIVIEQGRTITTAEEAARVYQEIIGRPDLDFSGLKFAAPELVHETPPPPINGTSIEVKT
jgi:hypothetical protein